MRVPLACLGSREQGSRAGIPVQLSENRLQNLQYKSFCHLVFSLENILTYRVATEFAHKEKLAVRATAAFAFNSIKIPVSCTCLSFTKYQCVVGVQCVVIRGPVRDPVDTRI